MNPGNLFDLPFEDEREDRAIPTAPGRRVWTVSELTAAIRTTAVQVRELPRT